MKAPKKYYYQGYECLATWTAQDYWHCTVENVTHPFAFEASDEKYIQGNLEREVHAYIQRCYDKGIEPRRSLMAVAQQSRHAAMGEALRKSHQQREKKEKQKEREFQRSPWRFALPVMLVGIPALGYLMLAMFNRVMPFTMFFPYRAHVQSRRFPLLTIGVCVICWLVFAAQWTSHSRYEANCDAFLNLEAAHDYRLLAGRYCWPLEYLRRSKDQPVAALADMQTRYLEDEAVTEAYSIDEIAAVLEEALPLYDEHVPTSFDADVMFWPNRGDFSGMYSSQFAHADLGHIFFNLVFFFAFAATVERLAGHGFFLLMFAFVPLMIGVFDSDSVFGSGLELGVPSLGLSGMCAAFLGALLVLMPQVQIKTFFWFIYTVRTYLVPVWFLGAWYIGFDVMNMLDDHDIGGVGYLAHVTGAFSGIGLALLYKHFFFQPLNHDDVQALDFIDDK